MPYMKNENGMTQRNRAYTLLREALVAGKIPGGSRLREAEWAGRLRVNRSALREAFGRLCGEGLLVEGPKRGYFVAHFEPDEVKDVLEVCAALEVAAIDRICRLGLNTRRNLKPLGDACDELEWLLGKGYSFELNESDRHFHKALVAAAVNDSREVPFCLASFSSESERNGSAPWASKTIVQLAFM